MVNMETRITAAQLAEALADILNRVYDRGERFVIERDGKPVASLTPPAPIIGVPLARLIEHLGDMPMPGEGFADDLESLLLNQPRESIPEWHS